MSEHAMGNEALVAARVRHGWHTQQDFVDAYERHARELGEQALISVRQVRRWESVRPTWPNRDARRVLTHMYGTALEDLGFVRPSRPGREPEGLGPEQPQEELVRRRSFLGVAAGVVPLLDLTGLEHLASALGDARRYGDHHLVAHLRSALDESARADSHLGPHRALPAALGILAAIDTTARTAQPAVRRDLLALGARAAEFTAWLHRDGGSTPQTTTYWHDRAIEWATVSGDDAMHAYVLLRKAQAADRDDPARMRDLAHAAVHGPWALPARARAEALQQEARALALTGATADDVARTLDQAHEALASAPPAGAASCTGPLCEGYTEQRLMVQSAICHREAGESERAVDLFQQYLPAAPFAPRDRAFFTAHWAGALAAAGEADEAASTAILSLDIAAPARFGQAIEELRRTSKALAPHARRPAVRDLRDALAAIPAAV
ncbi:XRE family transcriptional regulator [Streptomyces sp. SID13666]|uniref:XRE family transcriptional regulator n=1 Tax=Streptomyces sp. SID13666 TaxID=2706054 RepID=UPI0013C207C8|nr:XRE family transcriptional regulator [Streptomyces sp. SID13666]NEA59550.1 XRE family transcriptional regulator [Streptomyces sp. SID13666]